MTSGHFSWIYAGDGIRISAAFLLVGWIVQKRSCKGISAKMQSLLAIVNFLELAYAIGGNDFFDEAPIEYTLFIDGTVAVAYVILLYLVNVRYKETVETDYDTFWIEIIIILGVCLALPFNSNREDPLVVLFYCSKYLECVSLLPQIYFNFRTGSKNLGVSLSVFLFLLYQFFYIYYELNGPDDGCIIYSLYPAYIQMSSYALYFFLLVVVPKYAEKVPLSEIESCSGVSTGDTVDEENPTPIPVVIVTRPQLSRQQSLLETPFLKKTLPSSNSLLSVNPEGSIKDGSIKSRLSSPTARKKAIRRSFSKPNVKSRLDLDGIPRTQSSASSLFSLGMSASEGNTPEDEGITFTCKETAKQSRQKRIAYVRQTSLPESNSTSSPLSSRTELPSSKNEENNNNYIVPDNRENSACQNDSNLSERHEPKEGRTNQVKIYIGEDEFESSPKVTRSGNKPAPKSTPVTRAKKHSFFNEMLEAMSKVNESPKASPVGRKRRRATVHHPGSPNSQHNWKTMASNLIGTSPTYMKQRKTSVSTSIGYTSDDEVIPKQKLRRKTLWHI